MKRRFKFANEQNFINKTVKFAAALRKHVKLAAFQSQETIMMFPEVISNWWVFMFNDALVNVSGCHSNIICITQITFKYVNNAILVYQVRFLRLLSDWRISLRGMLMFIEDNLSFKTFLKSFVFLLFNFHVFQSM